VNRARSYGRKVEVVDDTANLAFPKVAPKGEEIDYSALAIPKAAPVRDRDYLAMIRSELCAAYSNDCGGVTEAAHLESPHKGIKTDDYLTVPLCSVHHATAHQVGISTFQINEGVNLWRVAMKLLVKWVRRNEPR
jgi:hypothetical protein